MGFSCFLVSQFNANIPTAGVSNETNGIRKLTKWARKLIAAGNSVPIARPAPINSIDETEVFLTKIVQTRIPKSSWRHIANDRISELPSSNPAANCPPTIEIPTTTMMGRVVDARRDLVGMRQ